MQVIKPGLCYQLDDGNLTKIVFAHHDARLGVNVSGTTTDELLQIIAHKHKTDHAIALADRRRLYGANTPAHEPRKETNDNT
jgi:hypothetical protein